MILKPFNAEKIKLAKTDSEKKGYENEKQVAYLLDFHYKDSETTAILHDIRFTYNGRTAQIDHLIITHGFLFVIESKMYSGVLEINSNSWTVDYGKVRHSIPSPVKQNDRHIKVLIDIIENESIFPKNRFVPTCINAVVVSNNTIINGTYPNEVVYADSFDDWVKKAKIKWIAKHPHKLFTLKEMMSADEVQSSAKRLLVFDKTISADISTVKQQEEKTHGAKNEENSAERTLDEHLARVINEQFNELNQIQQVTEDKNTLSNSELLRKLKDLRSKLAIQHKVKMLHHIFDNRTLEDFVAKKPQTKEEMLKISGVGLIKFDRYGEAFLYACSSTNADVE